ncbi:MAG: ACT domain-containing protein [Burkholderiaceae bacterium]
MGSLVMTWIGPDRPGVVRAISDRAAEHGANWSDSLMANFAGQFAGIVHLQVTPEKSQALEDALRALESDDLHVLVSHADGGAPSAGTRRLHLALIGHDRPGIIHSISTRLATQGVSIDKMKTHISSGAMSGEQMFHLDAQLTAPQALDTDTLRDGLESLANELMVDITFDNAAEALPG